MLSLNFPTSVVHFKSSMEEDWGLQAVVGIGGDAAINGFSNIFTESPEFCFDPFGIQSSTGYDYDYDFDLDLEGLQKCPVDDDLIRFSTPGALGNELEQLYKPFYPVFNTDLSQHADQLINAEEESKEEIENPPSESAPSNLSKYKRRKNQSKKVLQHVTTEDLSSDKWAWRKYGQKPIKGSPYPRSYYRCSSSKGCPARKQVEQSGVDPVTFVLIYTGEHNHTQPTRRNSLAGTTRQRFSNSKRLQSDDSKMTAPAGNDQQSSSSSPISTSAVSPTTAPMGISDSPHSLMKQEISYSTIEDVRDYSIPRLMFYDDEELFEGLNDLVMTPRSDFGFDGCFYNQQFSHQKYM